MSFGVLAILAGGKATRLGGIEKVSLDIGGASPLARILATLGTLDVFDEVFVMTGSKDPEPFRRDTEEFTSRTGKAVRFVKDLVPDAGPLAGLHAALLGAGGRAVFLCAGDVPFPSCELCMTLKFQLDGGAEVALARSARGLEPLFAWYAPSVIEAVTAALERGERRVISFFPDVRVAILDEDDSARVADTDRAFINLNTPEDVAAVVRNAHTAPPMASAAFPAKDAHPSEQAGSTENSDLALELTAWQEADPGAHDIAEMKNRSGVSQGSRGAEGAEAGGVPPQSASSNDREE
jgi:molybdopterin-guanine dinucleotide biosynthesis protein A